MASGEILHITSEPTETTAPTPLDNFFRATQPGAANFATEINLRSGMIREEGLPYLNGRSPFEPSLSTEQSSIANNAPAPLSPYWEEIVNEAVAAREFAHPKTDVSHVSAMTDEALDSVADRISEEQQANKTPGENKKPKALPSIPRYVPQAVAVAAGIAGVATGVNIAVDTSAAQAAGFVLTGGGGGDICKDPEVKTYIASHPDIASADDPNVAQAAIGGPTRADIVALSKTISIPIKTSNGEVIIKVVKCDPEGFPTNVDDAQQFWLSGNYQPPYRLGDVTGGGFNTSTPEKPLKNQALNFTGVFLGQKTIGQQTYALMGFEDGWHNPYTAVLRLGANQNSDFFLAHLPGTSLEDSSAMTWDPMNVEKASRQLEGKKGKTLAFFLYNEKMSSSDLERNRYMDQSLKVNKAFFRYVWNTAHTFKYYLTHEKMPYINKTIDEVAAEGIKAPTTGFFILGKELNPATLAE